MFDQPVDLEALTLFELSDRMAQECFEYNLSHADDSHARISKIRQEMGRRDLENAKRDRELVELYRENRTLTQRAAREAKPRKSRVEG